MKKMTIACLTVLTIFLSCKKDKEDKPDTKSRQLRYEITGNFTGTVFASYTTAAGSTANDQVTLPWNKDIDYAANVTVAIILVTGNGGIAGQKVTVVIKKGGSQVGAPIEAVANSSGSFSQPAPVVVF